MNVIRLINDKYENDGPFIDIPIDVDRITKDRYIDIYTWGIKKQESMACDVVFDFSKLVSKISKDVNIKNHSGLESVISDRMKGHPRYNIMINTMIDYIETNDPKVVGVVCNYGKHRSVSFGEILKNDYYPHSKITHLSLGKKFII